MRRWLAVAGTCAIVGVVPGDAQQPVFRGTGETVRVFVTVTDRDERLVTTLTRDNFEIRDRGRVQPITVFDNSPQPIQLIALIDVSGSMSGNLTLLRAAAAELVARLGAEDAAKVGTFGRDIVIGETFTRDVETLRGGLPAEIPERAPTPLWRALDRAIAAFDRESDRRRVVLVLSDGRDSGPISFTERPMSQAEVIDRARAADVMIYAIGLRSRGAVAVQPGIGRGGLGAMLTNDLPDPGLGRVAIETGGGYRELRPRDDLGVAFAQVMEELHSQYLLGFTPPARDGRVHDIEVRVNVRGLTPRARKSYIAPR